VITLTTDFGASDAYVAVMKGVILGINPAATLVDISHAIRPQDIQQAAFVLGETYPFFPPRTIHVAVVDPGVGTARKAVILRTPAADFVAPDNGILSYVLHDRVTPPAGGRARLAPGGGIEAIAITEPRFWRSPISDTFHGRDIFAPVAAHLSLGVPPAEFGEPLDELCVFPIPDPIRGPDGALTGRILHIDAFGNIVTNISRGDLPAEAAALEVSVGGEVIRGLSRTYDAGGGLIALIGSGDRLEISLPNGKAAARLRARPDDEIRINTKIK
jgi:S-adenosylmethionine hydrolase